MAKWPSLGESRGLLLEIAEHLDEMAKLEERGARKVMSSKMFGRGHDPIEIPAGYGR